MRVFAPLLASLLLSPVIFGPLRAADETLLPELSTYLARPEPDYSWKIEETRDIQGAKVWRLKMVSQVWQGITWTHDLLIALPPGAKTGKVLLINDGGGASEERAAYAVKLATKTGAPVALLLGVPNQPLLGGKVEDDLIAETFIRYLDSGDASWPLLFPMVKSVVKAMDTVQALAKQENWEAPVEKFIVGGASKRGWTTWLTAASDPRVMAITPMVIDVLNMRQQLTHQEESLGGPSEQISPYTRRGLVPVPDTPRAQTLWSMIDPWSYRQRFTMPKLIVLGNNDPYWSTDALNLYWDALPGEKYISYTPNAGHDLAERDEAGAKLNNDRAINNVAAFVKHQLDGTPMPKLAWTFTGTDDSAPTLTVTADPAPQQARMWAAHSATRDFRKARWESTSLTLTPGQPIVATPSRPSEGFTAFYADLRYQEGEIPEWLCTQLKIVGPKQP